jgi:hypothetical protein
MAPPKTQAANRKVPAKAPEVIPVSITLYLPLTATKLFVIQNDHPENPQPVEDPDTCPVAKFFHEDRLPHPQGGAAYALSCGQLFAARYGLLAAVAVGGDGVPAQLWRADLLPAAPRLAEATVLERHGLLRSARGKFSCACGQV